MRLEPGFLVAAAARMDRGAAGAGLLLTLFLTGWLEDAFFRLRFRLGCFFCVLHG